ncbi:MAG: YraN family protein [Patescibacteria group bacterium]
MKISNPLAVLGEDLACEVLRKKGYKIIERNFRKGYGEIDIIATHKDVLVFIEVKARTSNNFGTPLESVTPWKIKTLLKTAQFYKMKSFKLPDAMRLDAVAVILDKDNNPKEIEHIENISQG